jgi:hypothetical protein
MDSTRQLSELSPDAPKVAVLAPRWHGTDEVRWAVRQVAGALACSANVHVITTQGDRPRNYDDGVFVVHELATEDHAADRKRDLVLAALGASTDNRASRGRVSPAPFASEDPSLLELLVGTNSDPWRPGSACLSQIAPDVIVLTDYRQAGALDVVDKYRTDAHLVLVPLGTDLRGMTLSVFARLFERADAVLVFTESERGASASLVAQDKIHLVSLPLAVNQSVNAEPHQHAGGDRDYMLVIPGKPSGSGSSGPWADLLRARFPDRAVVVAGSGVLEVYKPGSQPLVVPAARSTSDLLRLMAWARMTVDARPGSLFARRSLQSLMFGTPIIVPEGSRAQEHAETGSGGLWFDGPGELFSCVETMLDPEVHDSLGSQGRRYALDRYGSTASFIERVGLVLSERQ